MTAADKLDGDTQPPRRWRATVALRIPRNGGGELVAEAATRLEATQGVETATVERLAGLEPALAATVARLEVTLVTRCHEEQVVRASLEAAPGLQRIEQLDRG
jgi:hypothetical protein